MGKLTVKQVKHAPPGTHVDGLGLLLRVRPSGSRSWILRVQVDGVRRDIGLGSDADLTLAEAREKAAHLRKIARRGLDPVVERDKHKRRAPTFAKAIEEAHRELAKGWEPKTGEAFRSSLLTHAKPVIGSRKVDTIDAADVISVLEPIWTSKPDQAKKVRRRVIQVLAFAKARGWRSEPVPEAAEIRRGLARQKKSEGFRAMPYSDLPAFFADELGKELTAARLALLFTILTAARSQEVRFARWEQFDRAGRLWNRPAQIMKSREAHTVTLSPAALAVLDLASERWGQGEFIFPSARKGKPLSDMSLSKMMRSAGQDATVHGFRSSFRDWAAESMPHISGDVAEMALAHKVGDRVVQAYLRSDLRALRFELVDAWGRYVAPEIGVCDE